MTTVKEEKASTTGARGLLIAASLVVVIAGLKTAAGLLLPFLVSVFVATVSLPLLNFLRNLGVPRPIAVIVTVLAVILVLVGVGGVIGTSLSGFTAAAPKYQERLDEMYNDARGWIETRGVELPDLVALDLINPGRLVNWITASLRAVAAVLSNMLLVLLTIVFILAEAGGFPSKLRAAFGRDAGASARFWKIRLEVQRYLAIKTLISLVTGGLVAAAMSIIGVDFALLWGALAFMLNYIPNLGSIIASIPPLTLAAVSLGPGHAIGVAIVFATINLTLGSFLEPYLMGRRLGLSTLVVFLSLAFWGWVWGPVGMLLSVPLTMILKIMLENTEDLRWIAVLLDAPQKEMPIAGTGT